MAAKYDLEGRDEVELRSPITNEMKFPTEEEVASCRPCRITFVVLFSLGLLGMLAAAIIVIATSSGCASKSAMSTPFWRKELAYQIYVPSFQDSNDDGYGDLKGIRTRLGYLEEIGVRIIVLSGLLSGENFKDLNPKSGSANDLKDLVAAAKMKRMSLVLEMEPTYTDSKSIWFIESSKRNSSSAAYKSWYVWRKTANNWKSKNGGSAWKLNPTYNENYYFYLDDKKPILNYNNSDVKREFKLALKFWLLEGIKGFKVNHVRRLVVDSSFNDNDFPNNKIYNKDQPAVHSILKEWNTIVKSHGGFLIGTGDDTALSAAYYGSNAKREMDLVLSNKFTGTPSGKIGPFLNQTISNYLKRTPEFAWPGWIFDGPQYSRLRDRYADALQCRLWNLLQLTLPGSSIFYYGDEILLKKAVGKSTSAMMWDKTKNGGFSKSNPWYAKSSVTPTDSVAAQKEVNGVFKATTDIMKLRLAEASLKSSSTKVLYALEGSIVYLRSAAGSKGFIIAINFSDAVHITKPKGGEAKKGIVVVDTLFKVKNREMNLEPSIRLEAFQGLVIRITE